MNVEIKSYGKVLTPTDSANVLCDGTSYGRKIVTPLSADESVWQEMPEATAEALCSAAAEGDEEISDEEFGAMVREVL